MIRLAANFGPGKTGLATVGYEIVAGDGTVLQARTAAGVAERAAGSGIYVVSVADSLIAEAGGGEHLWDTGEASPAYAWGSLNDDAKLEQVKAKTDEIGSASAVAISAVLPGNRMEIVQGDDYADAAGTAIEITIDNSIDLTTFDTLTLTLQNELEIGCTAVSSTVAKAEDITAAQTETLTVVAPPITQATSPWALSGTKSGHEQTIATGALTVIRKVRG